MERGGDRGNMEFPVVGSYLGAVCVAGISAHETKSPLHQFNLNAKIVLSSKYGSFWPKSY